MGCVHAKLRPISIVSIFVRSSFYCFSSAAKRIVLLSQGLSLRRDHFQSDAIIAFAFVFRRRCCCCCPLGSLVLPDCSLASRTPCFEKCKLKCTFAYILRCLSAFAT